MKIQRKWKPGGRPRRKNSTKKWLLKQKELLGGKEATRLYEPPLIQPPRRRKGA